MQPEITLEIVTVLCSTAISICGITIGWFGRKHSVEHTEYYKERQDAANIISSYAEVASADYLQIFYQRASAVKTTEGLDVFTSVMQKHQSALNMYTFQLLSIIDEDNDKLREALIEYKRLTRGCLIYLTDLKAAASIANELVDQSVINDRQSKVSNRIQEIYDIEKPIQEELQKLLAHYLKRIK